MAPIDDFFCLRHYKKAALPNYESMLDTENASTYDRYDFLSACQDMGIAKDIRK